MSGNRVLEDTLRQVLEVVKPENGDWVVRFRVIEDLKEVVQSLETLRGATVEPFGSFVSNLFTQSGDLDISVELANGSFISLSGKKERQRLLKALMRAMRRRGGWDKYIYIPHARVPILKVECNSQNISCDISIDNLQAQMKSKFLLWISDIDARFRDMVLLVKEWAKAHNINNPKSGTFNSFSLTLLVVFHFQTCDPPIFPPLQDIYPGNIADDLKGVRADAERQIAETCAANILTFKSKRNGALNHSSLSELFISFLAKFSGLGLTVKDWGICPFTGSWEYIKGITKWLPHNYAIFVEDPFEQPENCARAVNSRQLERISEVFMSSHNRLTSGSNNNKNALLATLAQYQTNQRIQRHQRNYQIPRQPVLQGGTPYQPIRPARRNQFPQSQNRQHLPSPVNPNPQPIHPARRNQFPQSQNRQHLPSPVDPNPQPQAMPYQNSSTPLRAQAQPFYGQARPQQEWKPRSS